MILTAIIHCLITSVFETTLLVIAKSLLRRQILVRTKSRSFCDVSWCCFVNPVQHRIFTPFLMPFCRNQHNWTDLYRKLSYFSLSISFSLPQILFLCIFTLTIFVSGAPLVVDRKMRRVTSRFQEHFFQECYQIKTGLLFRYFFAPIPF